MTHHLSYYTIDQYVHGLLTREERSSIDDHACECEDCSRKITTAALCLRVESRILQMLMEPEDGAELVGGPVRGRVVCVQS